MGRPRPSRIRFASRESGRAAPAPGAPLRSPVPPAVPGGARGICVRPPAASPAALWSIAIRGSSLFVARGPGGGPQARSGCRPGGTRREDYASCAEAMGTPAGRYWKFFGLPSYSMAPLSSRTMRSAAA